MFEALLSFLWEGIILNLSEGGSKRESQVCKLPSPAPGLSKWDRLSLL